MLLLDFWNLKFWQSAVAAVVEYVQVAVAVAAVLFMAEH
jgi:hypothetical protein